MNAHSRLSIAILVSLLAHIILLMWFLPQVPINTPNDQGRLRVFLQQYPDEHARRRLLPPVEAASSSNSRPETKDVRPAPIAKAKPPQANTDDRQFAGHFHWQPPPSYPQNEVMNAMLQAQFAHQRESRIAAVLAGMSNLSVQLRSVLTGRIVCAQQSDNEIDCTPAPDDKTRLLLVQLFNLAVEARRLGISENPVRMDFGPELGVSVALLP